MCDWAREKLFGARSRHAALHGEAKLCEAQRLEFSWGFFQSFA